MNRSIQHQQLGPGRHAAGDLEATLLTVSRLPAGRLARSLLPAASSVLKTGAVPPPPPAPGDLEGPGGSGGPGGGYGGPSGGPGGVGGPGTGSPPGVYGRIESDTAQPSGPPTVGSPLGPGYRPPTISADPPVIRNPGGTGFPDAVRAPWGEQNPSGPGGATPGCQGFPGGTRVPGWPDASPAARSAARSQASPEARARRRWRRSRRLRTRWSWSRWNRRSWPWWDWRLQYRLGQLQWHRRRRRRRSWRSRARRCGSDPHGWRRSYRTARNGWRTRWCRRILRSGIAWRSRRSVTARSERTRRSRWPREPQVQAALVRSVRPVAAALLAQAAWQQWHLAVEHRVLLDVVPVVAAAPLVLVEPVQLAVAPPARQAVWRSGGAPGSVAAGNGAAGARGGAGAMAPWPVAVRAARTPRRPVEEWAVRLPLRSMAMLTRFRPGRGWFWRTLRRTTRSDRARRGRLVAAILSQGRPAPTVG